MSIRYDTEKEAEAAGRFQRYLVKERERGNLISFPRGRDKMAQDYVVRCELQRMLGEQWPKGDPPRAAKFQDKDTSGYLIVYRNRQGGPAQTIRTGLDEAVVRAMISRIEAEGDTILTGKSCALCDLWMVPERGIAWPKVLNEDERDAALAVIEDGFLAPSEVVIQCCSDCWHKAHERIKADLLARYDEWWETEKAAREASRWHRAGRKMRSLLGLGL